jgi:ubiquinone/menaquinone biosynthesis C-methylase UbiE
MTETNFPPLFWEIHSGLPREGPGDKASTQRAYLLASELPAKPDILDIGCGPGKQTLDLAEISQGQITAVDTHDPFLHDLKHRAAAAGFSKRIQAVKASMFDLPFADQSFDLIWCEGAMYFLGFEAALKQWKRLLKPGGFLAVTEPCWLKSERPKFLKDFWSEYPAMTNISSRLAQIIAQGYREQGHFVLPDSAWWQDYYTPMLARIQQLRQKYATEPTLLTQLDEAEQEPLIHKQSEGAYGYVFFVMQLRPENEPQ